MLWLFAHLIVFGRCLQALVVVQVLLGGDLTGQRRRVEQHARLLITQTGQRCNRPDRDTYNELASLSRLTSLS